jgi:hypothetical protein
MSQMPGTQDVAVHLNPASVTTYFAGMQQRDVSFLEVRMDVLARIGIAATQTASASCRLSSMLCCAVPWHMELHKICQQMCGSAVLTCSGVIWSFGCVSSPSHCSAAYTLQLNTFMLCPAEHQGSQGVGARSSSAV